MAEPDLRARNEEMIALMRDRLLHVGELPRWLQRPVRALLNLLLGYFLMVRREWRNG